MKGSSTSNKLMLSIQTSVKHFIESTMIFCFINYLAWVLVTMLESYLSSRTQQVKFENALSKVIDVPLGAPQGSYLNILIYTYV